MTYRAIDPNALEVRRDALERASRFLDQANYAANIRGPSSTPTVADLTGAADAILAWMIQPLPGDPNAEPEPAQQATNVQAEPGFRDITQVLRHSAPGGGYHSGPYALCPTCQVGHDAIQGVPGCSPLAQGQHANAIAERAMLQSPCVGPSAAPKSAEPNTTRTPMDEGPSLSLVRERDHEETGLSKTYKRPY